MTGTDSTMRHTTMTTFEGSLAAFLRALAGENKSGATITAYPGDVRQFVAFLRGTNCAVATPADVTRADVGEHRARLAGRGRSAMTRAPKLASTR